MHNRNWCLPESLFKIKIFPAAPASFSFHFFGDIGKLYNSTQDLSDILKSVKG